MSNEAIIQLLTLPDELLQMITLQNLTMRNGSLEGRKICKQTCNAIDGNIQFLWNELKKNPPSGPIDLKKLTREIDKRSSKEEKPLKLFRMLNEQIAKKYGVILKLRDVPILPTHFAEMQKIMQQRLLDESLIKIWEAINKQYLILQNLPNPESADEIRAFLNEQSNIPILNSISDLDLQNLNLEVLPPEICRLAQLNALDLSNNKLKDLSTLNTLTLLRRLGLNNNRFTEIDLSSFPQLYELGLNNNQLQNITGLNLLTQLKLLGLGNNQLKEINLSSLIQLTKLYLNNNKLQTIIGLNPLPLLKLLELSNNQLTEIDLNIFPKLTWLNLNYNQLTTIPPLISLTQLQTLKISNNKLLVIDLSRHTELIELDLCKNELTTIELSQNTKLHKLYLDDNCLKTLDLNGISLLEELHVARNQLTYVSGFGALSHLQELDLGTNKFSVVPGLDSLPLLKRLNLKNNQFASINLNKLTQLLDLDLSGNLLNSIDLNAQIFLEKLILRNNMLSSIDLSNMTHLEVLDLRNNNLTILPDLSTWAHLEEFFLDDNPWVFIPRNVLEEFDYNPVVKQFAACLNNDRDLMEQHKIDDSLVTIWGVIINNVLPLHNLPRSESANEIRACLNDPTNTPVINSITTLDLTNKRLTAIPPEMFKLTQLKQLFLNDNQLTTINLRGFSQLQVLHLARNRLIDVFGLDSLSQLQELDLRTNRFSVVPGLDSLPHLKWLNLKNNQFTSINLSKLTNLLDLDLSGNLLNTIDLSAQIVLEKLILRNNMLSSLDLSKMTQLEVLDLRNNKLTILPDLSTWAHLEELFLDDNPWVFIPRNVLEEFDYNPVVKQFVDQLNYKAQTSIAHFYQMIMQNSSITQLKEGFASLPANDKQAIYYAVYYQALWELPDNLPENLTSDEQFLFKDMPMFYRALQKMYFPKLEKLSQSKKDSVFDEIYRLSCIPLIERAQARQWAMQHAQKNVPRLIDALTLAGSQIVANS